MPRPVRDPDLEGDDDFEPEDLNDDGEPQDGADPIDEDDEPGDDDADEGDEQEEDGSDDGEDPPAREPTRGENRVARATREAKEAREETKRLREEVEALKTTRPTNTAPAETQAQRDARLADMDPADRLDYLRREDRSQLEGQIAAMRFEGYDRDDKSAFRDMCRENPAMKGVQSDVEKELLRMRSQGQNATRETIAVYMIGRRAVERGVKAAPGQRQKADDRVKREKGRPTGARSDTGGGNKRSSSDAEARRKRLENMEI